MRGVILIAIAVVAVALALLFPPWQGVHPSDASLVMQSYGWAWYASPPLPMNGFRLNVIVDQYTLMIEIVSIVAFTALGFIVLHLIKDAK